MSGSGSSTPRSTETPPPGTSEGPSPLIVGTRFVKQYYKVLSTTPDQIIRFYQPTSYLSQGVGSQHTEPAVFDKDNVAQLKDRFYLAQSGGEEGCPLRFEFEHGAIDAQLSVNGGVLLVVTGHLVYMSSSDEDEDVEDEDIASERRKAFVHTFFLGSLVAGSKRSYYVHNDVLRFLHEDEEKPSIQETRKEKVTAAEPVVEVAPSVEPVVPVEPEVVEEAPGRGVEESKEVEEEATLVAPVATEDTQIETSVESKPSKPVVPGSWASMVARSGGTSGGSTSSGPSTPVRPSASKATIKPKSSAPAPARAVPDEAAGKATAAARGGKRDPDFTLVIKNISDDVTEADVLSMFEPFAAKAEAKIQGTTVSAHKGIAFVDFSSAAPVLAAVAQHGNTPLQMKGRELDIYQKTLEQKGRGGSKGRGVNSSKGGPSNGSAARGGGGSGRQQKGRGDRGRGERGKAAGGRSSER